MGTNYYTATNVCEHCKRFDRDRHIGKSSGGWTFSFRGYRADYEQPKIQSYADWLVALEGARIFNEYGDEVLLDEFKALVEEKRDAKYNHTTYCLSRPQDRQHALESCWLDDEGNSFCDNEFS